MTSAIKYMQNNHSIELGQLERLRTAIQSEFKKKKEPTHISADLFTKLAEPLLKVPDLVETQLYKYLLEGLTEIITSGGEETAMFSMKYLGMFIELYSCVLPVQQSSLIGKNLLKNMRRTTSNHQNHLRTSVSTTLDTANKLRDEALKMRQRSRMDSQHNSV